MTHLVILHADDWSGLWADGALKDEGHRIDLASLAKHCPVESITEYYVAEEGASLLNGEGQFRDIPLAEAIELYV